MLSPAHSDSLTGIGIAVQHLQLLASCLNVKIECGLDNHIRLLTEPYLVKETLCTEKGLYDLQCNCDILADNTPSEQKVK